MIDRAYRVAKLAFVLVLMWAAVALTLKTSDFLDLAGERLESNSQHINRVLVQWGGVMTVMRRAALAQETNADATGKNVAETTHQAALLIADSRVAVAKLNNDVLPQLTASLAHTDEDMAKVATEAAKTLQGLSERAGPVLDNAALATKNLAELTGDPAFRETAKNMQAASASLAGTSANVDATSKDVAEVVHRMTRPKAWFKQLGSWVLDTAYKFKAFF